MDFLSRDRRLDILLVEDSEGDAELIRTVLQGRGGNVRVERAVRLSDALKRLRSERWNAVLLDLKLPDAEGPDAVRQAVEVAADVPVVVLTGLDEELARRCLEAGAEDFVEKNHLDRATMLRSIDHAMSRARTKALTLGLQRSQRLAAIGQLAAGVAHEVNNPAASMLMNLELLGREIMSMREQLAKERVAGAGVFARLEEMDQVVGETLDAVARIASVTRALKLLSREQPPALETVDVTEVCRSATEVAAADLRGRVQLDVQLAPLAMRSDAAMLFQILTILLDNAVESFGSDGQSDAGHIRVVLESDARWARLIVSDTGIGIPADRIVSAFDPFFSTKSPSRHPGLGLSMCAELVERLSGRVELDSAPGKGTQVTVLLPKQGLEIEQDAVSAGVL